MDKTWLSRLNLEKPHTILIKEVKKLKRIGYLWEPFISDENILKAIKEVNKTHKTSSLSADKSIRSKKIMTQKKISLCGLQYLPRYQISKIICIILIIK